MEYKVGGVITCKKAHVCGGKEWQVIRIGADIKVKCLTCGRVVFLNIDKARKITKSYQDAKEVKD